MISIVLEGPDGVGKTTAAKEIMSRSSEHAYHHEGVPPQGTDLIKYYEIIWESIPKPAVVDRFIAGELVYGTVMRNGARFTVADVLWFIERKWKSDVVHVLLLPPIQDALLAWDDRNKNNLEYVTGYDNYRRIYSQYEYLSEVGMFDVVVRPKNWNISWVDRVLHPDFIKPKETLTWTK